MKNITPAPALGTGVYVRTRSRGLDVDWTTAGRYGECYVYVMRTLEPSWGNSYIDGYTMGTVEVVKHEGAWHVRLFGEILPEQYAFKGYAQSAAEKLVGLP